MQQGPFYMRSTHSCTPRPSLLQSTPAVSQSRASVRHWSEHSQYERSCKVYALLKYHDASFSVEKKQRAQVNA
ncbi:hypothetical protein BD413DRAFT_592636 [Trametes elegans]|nr:hypothetical protein BD413DRAFT_592636 [Trametes elegans]